MRNCWHNPLRFSDWHSRLEIVLFDCSIFLIPKQGRISQATSKFAGFEVLSAVPSFQLAFQDNLSQQPETPTWNPHLSWARVHMRHSLQCLWHSTMYLGVRPGAQITYSFMPTIWEWLGLFSVILFGHRENSSLGNFRRFPLLSGALELPLYKCSWNFACLYERGQPWSTDTIRCCMMQCERCFGFISEQTVTAGPWTEILSTFGRQAKACPAEKVCMRWPCTMS